MGYSTTLSSASGILALLEEHKDEIKEHALKKLNDVVPEFWPEIADALPTLQTLFKNEHFKSRELAALVASKVYYHLEKYHDALTYALGAGKLFDVSVASEYVDTVVAKCIDEYIRLRNEQAVSSETIMIDSRLERIVLGMFDRCFVNKKFKQALGIAVEARRLDKIEQAISGSEDLKGMLIYAQKLCMDVIKNRDFRHKVLELLVKLYQSLKVPDYLRMSEILIFLDNPARVTEILLSLLESREDEKALIVFQIAFDLYTNATQQFRSSIINSLPPSPKEEEKKPDAMEIEKTDIFAIRLSKLKSILSGEKPINLFLNFLFRNNKTDLLILKNIKSQTEGRTSVLHNAALFANAFMHCGTTSDVFLRENLEWLSRATNWAKFSAIAGLGAIHKGHLKEGLTILGPYLPQPGSSGSAYQEGGSLYALGLIHATHGAEIVEYLLNSLRGASGNEIVQHGACLGLGVAAMATANELVFEELKTILYMDSAVAGEAAGLAMGLVMLGSASQTAVNDLLTYAHETQHEKIIRGLAVGLSLVMYGREEEADTLVEQLLLDKDAILRYGAMYTIGLAYAGTANNNAIRRLLHFAVSDVSDDVRRAAVISLGFVLCKVPDQCPKIVGLLAESYNPHVRYGAALALGISCAGSGLKEAVALLEPLTSDIVDFVRQGALIALSMVLLQQTKAREPKVETIRKMYEDKLGDKHEETMCKFGAILSAGIIDAGGRNVTIATASRSGHINMNAIVGLAVFTQYWYWYPLAHFLSLSFTPTVFLGLNKNLEMPVMNFKSNAKPSVFGYPPMIKPPETKPVEKVQSAVLSITKKKELRDKKTRRREKKERRFDGSRKTGREERRRKERRKERRKKGRTGTGL